MAKPQTSKLFKLKQWLTLPDAAKHLSDSLGEEIKERDLLRLALDGHLKLSVLFGDYTRAKLGTTVSMELIKEFANGKPIPPNFVLVNDEYIKFGKNIKRIYGVWDLSMYGNERKCIEIEWEHLNRTPTNPYQPYKHEINGDEICDGVIVSKHILFAQLQISKSYILYDYEKEEFFNGINSRPEHENYCPLLNLPLDCILVVRTKVLKEFEQLISDTDQDKNSSAKPHGNTEINSQKREQILGAALSVLAKWPEKCQNNAGEIEATKIRVNTSDRF